MPTHYRQLPDADAENNEVGHYGRIIWRHKWLITANIVLCLAVAIAYTRLQTPIYKAKTSLEVQEFNDKFLNRGAIDPIARITQTNGSPNLEAELTILHSRELIRRVVQGLHLENEPEFRADRNRPWLDLFGRRRNGTEEDQVIDAIQNSLDVAAVPQTDVISVSFRSSNPATAAKVVNTLAQEFINQNLETRVKSDQHTSDWLARQLSDAKAKLETAEEQLQEYQRTNGLLLTDGTESVVEQKLKQIQIELSAAEADRIVKQSRLQAILQIGESALPDVVGSSALNQYQTTLTALRQQLANAESLWTPNHFKVKQLRAEIAELENAVTTEGKNILVRVRSEFDAAQDREKLLSAAFAAQANAVSEQDSKAVRYSVLKREVDTNRQVYDSVLQTVREANIASALQASNIVVLDPAEPPRSPYTPKVPLNISIGLATGLFFGMAFAIFRARGDCTFREPGELSACLDLPELGSVPAVSTRSLVGAGAKGNGWFGHLGSGDPQPYGRPGNELGLAANQTSQSAALAEAFRVTLASIMLTIKQRTPCVIICTSAESGEGKTTSITNLALTMAMSGRRVLLIDGDMRRPRLHDVWNLANDRGLSDLLTYEERLKSHTLNDVIRSTTEKNLYILPGGPLPDNPAGLLYSARLPELIRLCRTTFDAIFIDTPPVLKVADARILGSFADAAVLVCRAGETHRNAVIMAAQRLTLDGIPILGTILNDWIPSSRTSYLAYEGYRVGSQQ